MPVLIHQNPYQGLKQFIFGQPGLIFSSANSSKSLSGIETQTLAAQKREQVEVLIHQNPYQGLKPVALQAQFAVAVGIEC